MKKPFQAFQLYFIIYLLIKQKQADLKIIQARDDAIREVKSKATDLSTIIAKEYLKENIDDKISSDLVDKSIEDLKRNL